MATNDINKTLKPILNDVFKNKIKFDESKARDNQEISRRTIDKLIEVMKTTDESFAALYMNKIICSGSYYSGLRISQPTEFDFNMLLQMPFKEQEMTLLHVQKSANYVEYKIALSEKDQENISSGNIKKTVLQKLFKGLCLDRVLIQQWIQSVIDKAKENDSFKQFLRSNNLQFQRKMNGPAFTFELKTKLNETISVDLVPVIDGSGLPFPKQVRKSKQFEKMKTESKRFILVPVPLAGPSTCADNRSSYWSISFPEAEKDLLHDLGCIKKLIRLFKLLRDTQPPLKCISSYMIKSLFLKELDKKPTSADWKEDNMGTLFLHMLEKFQDAFHNENIPYYFIPKANLNDLKPEANECISNFFGNLKKKIEKNPQHLNIVFDNKT